MKNINLGCGENRLDGWENHDSDVDITKPLPWPENSVDFILAEHVFEHVSGPDALRFLYECHRILKPGGVLRLCVPVLDNLFLEAARDIVLNHGHLCAYNPGLLRSLLVLARFISARETERKECDGHWKIIGKEKDDAETCRIEATKRPEREP